MLTKPFGSAFTFPYYPKVAGEAIDPVAQSPTIYIFDSKPTDDNARNNTDSSAVETISSWTETSTNYRPFTVAAIADPADGSLTERYWAAINYIIATSGSSTLDIQVFRLSRPDGHTANIRPTVKQIKNEDKTLKDHFSDVEINAAIGLAENRVKITLDNKGMPIERVENPEDVTTLVKYRAIADLWLDEIAEAEDRFHVKFRVWEKLFEDLKDGIKLDVDVDGDDDISPGEEQQSIQANRLVR